MLGYNTTAGKYITSTVTSMVVKNTTNMIVINTGTGTPLRVDGSMTEVLGQDFRAVLLCGFLRPRNRARRSLHPERLGRHNKHKLCARRKPYDVGHHGHCPYFASGYLDPPHPS